MFQGASILDSESEDQSDNKRQKLFNISSGARFELHRRYIKAAAAEMQILVSLSNIRAGLGVYTNVGFATQTEKKPEYSVLSSGREAARTAEETHQETKGSCTKESLECYSIALVTLSRNSNILCALHRIDKPNEMRILKKKEKS